MENLEQFLEKSLLETPGKIKELQLDTISKNEELDRIQLEINEIESEIKFDILTKVDENNKKIFTNQEMRDSAFLLETKTNSNLQEKRAMLKKIQNQIFLNKTEISFLSESSLNYRTLLNFYTKTF